MSSKHRADRRLIGGWSPASRVRLAVILCAWPLSWALPVEAANKTWTNPVTGSWTDAARWTGGVPVATDSATFNQAGAYTVNFSNVFQSLNNMSFSAGTVTFERLVSPATLVIDNASGGRDLTVSGATLNLGQSLAVNITVGNDAIINSGGTINVRAGSFLNPQDLFVNAGGTLSLANGTITPSGTTQVNGAATISQGQLAGASLTIGSSVGDSGTVQVSGPSTLTTGLDIYVGFGGTGTLAISGGGDVTSRSAVLGLLPDSMGTATVTGVGSTWTFPTGGIGGGLGVGVAGTGVLTIESGGVVSGVEGAIASGTGTGTATVTGAGSSWTISGAMSVGQVGTGDLTVENGAAVNSGSGVIGELAGSIGNVTVTGPGSIWTTYGGTLPIGINGTGTLTISDGGTVDVRYFSTSPVQVSINALSTLNIGAGGAAGVLGTNGISNNGLIYFDHTDAVTIDAPLSGNGRIQKFTGAGDTTFADVSAYTGTFLVGGSRAILRGNANGSDYEASDGGTLRFENGTVNLNLASIRASAPTGVVEYDSAIVRNGFLRGVGTHRIVAGASPTSFNAVTTFNSTTIVQDGTASLINFTNGGTLTNNATLSLSGAGNASTGVMNINSTTFATDFGNDGVITVNSGGVLSNYIGNLVNGGGSRTTINAGGTIDLLSGTTLELNGALLVNNGTINGTTNVNYGSLAKGTGSYGLVNVSDGGVFAPGNSPGVVTAESLYFSNTSVVGGPMLAIELAGAGPGTEYDQVKVTGALSLGGTLAVSLINFNPSAGQAFDILDWGSLSGTFASLDLPTLAAGLSWNTLQLYATGVLSVGLPGDFNFDGMVDAADYVVWRKNDGTPQSYETWRANFGLTPGSGSSLNAAETSPAIPEPTSLVLLILAALTLTPTLSQRARENVQRRSSHPY